MSPHQRLLTLEASTSKSRRIRSARAAVGRGGDGRLLPPLRGAPPQVRLLHQPRDSLPAVPLAVAARRRVDPGSAVATPGLGVQLLDLLGQLGVLTRSNGGLVGALRVVGGTGDLQQLTRPLDVVVASLLRLDERVHVHRVSFAKNAVARLRISTSSCSRRLSRRSRANSSPSAGVNPPSTRSPLSRSACLTQPRPAVSVRSKSRATSGIDRSPRWHSSTISALNSGVNERRGRCFLFPMLSMVEHPSSGPPALILDVRQSGSTSAQEKSRIPSPYAVHVAVREPIRGNDLDTRRRSRRPIKSFTKHGSAPARIAHHGWCRSSRPSTATEPLPDFSMAT